MPPRPRNSHLLQQVQLGDEIEVWWPHDSQYYPGVVGSILPSGRHRILYTDGEVEDLRLATEQWRFRGAAAERVLAARSAAPPLDVPSPDALSEHAPASARSIPANSRRSESASTSKTVSTKSKKPKPKPKKSTDTSITASKSARPRKPSSSTPRSTASSCPAPAPTPPSSSLPTDHSFDSRPHSRSRRKSAPDVAHRDHVLSHSGLIDGAPLGTSTVVSQLPHLVNTKPVMSASGPASDKPNALQRKTSTNRRISESAAKGATINQGLKTSSRSETPDKSATLDPAATPHVSKRPHSAFVRKPSTGQTLSFPHLPAKLAASRPVAKTSSSATEKFASSKRENSEKSRGDVVGEPNGKPLTVITSSSKNKAFSSSKRGRSESTRMKSPSVQRRASTGQTVMGKPDLASKTVPEKRKLLLRPEVQRQNQQLARGLSVRGTETDFQRPTTRPADGRTDSPSVATAVRTQSVNKNVNHAVSPCGGLQATAKTEGLPIRHRSNGVEPARIDHFRGSIAKPTRLRPLEKTIPAVMLRLGVDKGVKRVETYIEGERNPTDKPTAGPVQKHKGASKERKGGATIGNPALERSSKKTSATLVSPDENKKVPSLVTRTKPISSQGERVTTRTSSGTVKKTIAKREQPSVRQKTTRQPVTRLDRQSSSDRMEIINSPKNPSYNVKPARLPVSLEETPAVVPTTTTPPSKAATSEETQAQRLAQRPPPSKMALSLERAAVFSEREGQKEDVTSFTQNPASDSRVKGARTPHSGTDRDDLRATASPLALPGGPCRAPTNSAIAAATRESEEQSKRVISATAGTPGKQRADHAKISRDVVSTTRTQTGAVMRKDNDGGPTETLHVTCSDKNDKLQLAQETESRKELLLASRISPRFDGGSKGPLVSEGAEIAGRKPYPDNNTSCTTEVPPPHLLGEPASVAARESSPQRGADKQMAIRSTAIRTESISNDQHNTIRAPPRKVPPSEAKVRTSTLPRTEKVESSRDSEVVDVDSFEGAAPEGFSCGEGGIGAVPDGACSPRFQKTGTKRTCSDLNMDLDLKRRKTSQELAAEPAGPFRNSAAEESTSPLQSAKGLQTGPTRFVGVPLGHGTVQEEPSGSAVAGGITAEPPTASQAAEGVPDAFQNSQNAGEADKVIAGGGSQNDRGNVRNSSEEPVTVSRQVQCSGKNSVSQSVAVANGVTVGIDRSRPPNPEDSSPVHAKHPSMSGSNMRSGTTMEGVPTAVEAAKAAVAAASARSPNTGSLQRDSSGTDTLAQFSASQPIATSRQVWNAQVTPNAAVNADPISRARDALQPRSPRIPVTSGTTAQLALVNGQPPNVQSSPKKASSSLPRTQQRGQIRPHQRVGGSDSAVIPRTSDLVTQDADKGTASLPLDILMRTITESNQISLQAKLSPLSERVEALFAENVQRIADVGAKIVANTETTCALQKDVDSLKCLLEGAASKRDIEVAVTTYVEQAKKAVEEYMRSLALQIKADLRRSVFAHVEDAMKKIAADIQRDSVMMISDAIDNAMNSSGLVQGQTNPVEGLPQAKRPQSMEVSLPVLRGSADRGAELDNQKTDLDDVPLTQRYVRGLVRNSHTNSRPKADSRLAVDPQSRTANVTRPADEPADVHVANLRIASGPCTVPNASDPEVSRIFGRTAVVDCEKDSSSVAVGTSFTQRDASVQNHDNLVSFDQRRTDKGVPSSGQEKVTEEGRFLLSADPLQRANASDRVHPNVGLALANGSATESQSLPTPQAIERHERSTSPLAATPTDAQSVLPPRAPRHSESIQRDGMKEATQLRDSGPPWHPALTSSSAPTRFQVALDNRVIIPSEPLSGSRHPQSGELRKSEAAKNASTSDLRPATRPQIESASVSVQKPTPQESDRSSTTRHGRPIFTRDPATTSPAATAQQGQLQPPPASESFSRLSLMETGSSLRSPGVAQSTPAVNPSTSESRNQSIAVLSRRENSAAAERDCPEMGKNDDGSVKRPRNSSPSARHVPPASQPVQKETSADVERKLLVKPTRSNSGTGNNTVPLGTKRPALRSVPMNTTRKGIKPGFEANASKADIIVSNPHRRKEIAFQARQLIGRCVIEWFLSGGCRRAAPSNERNHSVPDEWVKRVSDKCVSDVIVKLNGFQQYGDALNGLSDSLGNVNVELDWLLLGPSESNINRARRNYSGWDPKLMDFEWYSEKRVLAEVGDNIIRTQQDLMQRKGPPILQESPLSAAVCCLQKAGRFGR